MNFSQQTTQQKISEIEEYLNELRVLIRVNNLLLSKFILQLSEVRRDLNLPKRQTFFKFELLQDDYDSLVEVYGKQKTDKALYNLDRLLFTNKQQCPHNIQKYISNRLQKQAKKGKNNDGKQQTN